MFRLEQKQKSVFELGFKYFLVSYFYFNFLQL